MIAQQELDSCWVLLLVDMQAHTHCSSGTLAQLHVCSTRRADFAYSSTPCLQVQIGGCSPQARSLTPAGVLILRVRGIKRGATAVRLSPGMSVQPDIPFCVSALPPWSAKARRKLFCSCDGQTSACSCFVGVRGLTSRVSGLYTVCLLPLPAKASWKFFAPCVESNSCWVLFSMGSA